MKATTMVSANVRVRLLAAATTALLLVYLGWRHVSQPPVVLTVAYGISCHDDGAGGRRALITTEGDPAGGGRADGLAAAAAAAPAADQLVCHWHGRRRWYQPEELLSCIDLPSGYQPELVVVRALLVGPAWSQATTVVHLPGTHMVCAVALPDDHKQNAWVNGDAGRTGAAAVNGPTQVVFNIEYANATAALLDPEPEVAQRNPSLQVRTRIPYLGTLLQTTFGATPEERALAHQTVLSAAHTAPQCPADRAGSGAPVATENCTALLGPELPCMGVGPGDPRSPLELLHRPMEEWRLARFTWSETVGLGDVDAPWANKKVVLLGDSMTRKLAAMWTAALSQDRHTLPCACSTRPFALPHPASVAHIPLRLLEDSLDGALRALKFASASAEPGDILVVNAGLWNAAYGTLANYQARVRELLMAAAASRFQRVLWLTTTAIHPGRRRTSEHAMNAVLTWHNYFTTVRVDATNILALRQLQRLEVDRRILPGRIEVVDVTHMTRAAPWLTVPGDMVHYCPTILVEMLYLMQRQLSLGAPGRDSRTALAAFA